jgi:hypothetical protein
MKKSVLFAIMLFCVVTAFSQAVKDRNVIPVAINLNQVLRMTVTDGGNIEFVFNTIEDYRDGFNALGTNAQYETGFKIASSTKWQLNYGAESATFIGTDNPANTLALDNVGFTLTSTGTHALGTELVSVPTSDGTEVAALEAYGTSVLIDDGAVAATPNAGDETENAFTLDWECGTTTAGAVVPMNAVSLLQQSVTPDRYVVNVFFDLQAK